MKNEPVKILLSPEEAIFLGLILDAMNEQLMEQFSELDQDQRQTLEMSLAVRKHFPQAEVSK
jgi:hypothetical protein